LPGDSRKFKRRRLTKYVAANQGVPNRGGILLDLSPGGAAIIYPEDLQADGRPLKLGEVLAVNLGGSTTMPSRVVRVFDGGFAIEFEYRLDRRPHFSLTA